MTNVIALVDATNKVVIQHKLGGEINLVEGSNNPLAAFGFAAATTANLYVGPNATGLVASNWKPLVYTASGNVPLSLATDGQLWYSSVVDEVDILVHSGTAWVGLNATSSPYTGTNAEGPIVRQQHLHTQSDGSY